MSNDEIYSVINYLIFNRYFSFEKVESSLKSLLICFTNCYDKITSCDYDAGKIDLGIYFENEEMKNDFLSAFKEKYSDYLFGSDIGAVCPDVLKEKYFNELTKEEKIDFISSMSNDEIGKMLKGINDRTFYRCINSESYKKKVRERRTDKK